MFTGSSSFNILEGHSKATMLLIFNNAAQGILSSFFFKYAGKYIVKTTSEFSIMAFLKPYFKTVFIVIFSVRRDC